MRDKDEESSPVDKPENDSLRAEPVRRLWPRLLAIALLLLVLLAGAMGLTASWFKESLNRPQDYAGQTFTIVKGNTFKDFIGQLQQAGIVEEPYTLRLYARYKKIAGKMHTGSYRFVDGMSLQAVLEAITTGKYRLSHQFTFVQGSTFKQLRASLLTAKAVQRTLDGMSDLEVLALFDTQKQYSHPEGLFFPETYAYDSNAKDRDILKRAYKVMQDLLADLWQDRASDLQIKSPYEALILASIIEKETSLASERAKISGVFMNRLAKDMKLQTDPTVIYGMGDQYDGNIRRKDLTTDTPYNTYTRKGLPPTPIAMPGRAAIEAALHPEQTDAIFFVAKGDGSGGHTFSKTLKEHNRAVKAFLKARRKSG